MENTLHLYNQDVVQVAAHRGVSGVNIPCNTIAAYDVALNGGAAIIEMDLFQSVDGEIFIFHTGKEPFQLDRHINLEKLTSQEIQGLKLVNADFNETTYGLNTFDQVLEHLKGRCILNLDRFTTFLPDVIQKVEAHNMREQILLKNAPNWNFLKEMEEIAPRYMFMPIYKEVDEATEQLSRMNINFIGAELVFRSEQSPIARPEYIEKAKERGFVLWGNAITYNYKVPLSAGHTDDVSLLESPEKGWGWLADSGFDVIQTDWTYQCAAYLRNRFNINKN